MPMEDLVGEACWGERHWNSFTGMKGSFSGAPFYADMGKCSNAVGLALRNLWVGPAGGWALAPQAPKLSSVHSDPQVRWMMYWIVFAIFMAAETFTDVFISWFGTGLAGHGLGRPTHYLAPGSQTPLPVLPQVPFLL